MDIANVIRDVRSAGSKNEEEQEDPTNSKELELLIQRRKNEEKRKAQANWELLRRSISSTSEAVSEADIRDVVISHGIHHQRKLNHTQTIRSVVFLKDKKEYLTTDGSNVRVYLEDGRRKDLFTLEEPIDHIVHCCQTSQFVGWIHDEDELFLMDSNFQIISQSRVPSRIVLANYNHNTGEFITVGPFYLTCWVFRYGARHLISRKRIKTDHGDGNMFSHMVLEETASRTQKCFLSCGTTVVVYNLFEGNLLGQKKDMHAREITAITFFNPLKYLVTGARDGSIKVWDSKWHVKMVFVGHSDMVNTLAIYPHGPALVSASLDSTIRVWDLETSDEVDRARLEGAVDGMGTELNYNVFYTYSGKSVDLWRIQHLYHIHTSVGQRVVNLKHTNYPGLPVRSVLLCRDSSVRIVSPPTGDVITTFLVESSRGLVDCAYAIAEETMFTLMRNGDILKCYTDSNPCQKVAEWKCKEPSEACNYLLVYEYVVDIMLKSDTWGALKRGVATKSIKAAMISPQANSNRTLLLGGRKDGYICVFNWESGKVDFKVDAHGKKGVLNMIANSKADQLISAGKDNIIKVWRLYPFAEEALAPLMSFYCAHTPAHMTMIKTNLCVAFQDPSTATYSIVIYNLKDRMFAAHTQDVDAVEYRYDHKPDDDHVDAITGLTSCQRMKLYASSSRDGTIRIWNEANTLVRLLNIKADPHSLSFCSSRGDLLVGIGNHLYRIPYQAYMPKSYRFKMVSMKFLEPIGEKPLPYDENRLNKLSRADVSRLKQSHSSFKYANFMDILTKEEEDEVNRENNIRKRAFAELEARENELKKIRDGEVKAKRKPQTTKETKDEAFKNYMKMYYDKPKIQIPEDDLFPEDTVKDRLKGPPSPTDSMKWQPEQEPVGFFPPVEKPSTPLKAPYQITRSGFIPNSVLVKLLWPPREGDEADRDKKKEWMPPSLTAEQLEQITKVKKEFKHKQKVKTPPPPKVPTPVKEPSQEGLKRSVTFAGSGGDITGRVLDLGDWEDDEEMIGSPLDDVPSIWDIDDKKSKTPEPEKPPASSLMSKMQEIMERTPTPKEEEVVVPSPPAVISPDQAEKSGSSAGSVRAPPKPKRDVRPLKPIVKPTPVEPPAPRLRTKTPTAPEPSPTPPPRPVTPLPGFITQFRGADWFEKYFPNCNENTMPKPWTPDAFAVSLGRLIRIADYPQKVRVTEAVTMLCTQEDVSEGASHSVCRTVIGVLNHPKEPPTCMMEEQKNFILSGLTALNKLGLRDKDFVTEILVQFLDGDKEVRSASMDIMQVCGLSDPHHYLPKELDSWDIWNLEEADRKGDLRKMCQQWLDRWMTSYRLHIQDTIERMKKGQNIHGRLSQSQWQKRGTPPQSSGSKGILKTPGSGDTIPEDQETITTLPGPDEGDKSLSRNVTVTFDKVPDQSVVESTTYVDAVNYFCDMMMEKEIDSMRRGAGGRKPPGTQENVIQAKNTVLVLPKVPHKPALVRLGETHCSTCRPKRETNLHVDYRQLSMTSRGRQPMPGQLYGFTPSINLPMKPVVLNPFRSAVDAYDPRFQEPILITLKSAQKYFIPSQSVVPSDLLIAPAH